jgi:molybdopterin-guanine dinucleotide biosynthesis protein A
VEPFDAIVLAGGGGTRLGGVDKAEVTLGGQTLLDHTLLALDQADRIVVVGPARAGLERPERRVIVSAREDPPGGGPVAALAAGLDFVSHEVVVVLACDMPFFDAAAAARLVDGLGPSDGVIFVDGSGRRQYLAAAYRRAALLTALQQVGPVEGAAMRRLVDRLTIRELLADPETTLDCDTWDDIHRSRRILEER